MVYDLELRKLYANRQKRIFCGHSWTSIINKEGKLITWKFGGESTFDLSNPPLEIFIQVNYNFRYNIGIIKKNPEDISGRLIFWESHAAFVAYDTHGIRDKLNLLSGNFISIDCSAYLFVGLSENNDVVTVINTRYTINDKGWDNFISPVGKIISIACGLKHFVCLKEDGTIITCGNLIHGQSYDQPNGKFISISCGDYHSVALREDGTIVTWGSDYSNHGQKSFKENVPSGKFISISCISSLSGGIREDGTICTWGNDRDMTCWKSNGYGTPSEKFVEVVFGNGGYNHAFGIREDGKIIGWGDPKRNQQMNIPLENIF